MSSCFVAMPFHAPVDSYFKKLFEPAIEDAGLIGTRGDSLFQAGDIVRQVVQLIRDADVVLAELTQVNANVYYEVGIAHALRKPTILLSQSTATVPFDLRGGRVIVYSTEDPFWGEQLRTSITRSIVETIADPEGSLPPGLTLALADYESLEDGSKAPDRLSAIESRLGQLQRALGRSMRSEGLDGGALAQAESARETIAVLLDQGLDRASVIRDLVGTGVSELWAETAVDEELAQRGAH